MILTEPDEIYCEFLRAELSELTRYGLSAMHTNTSESFDGTGAEDTFTVTNTKLLCINSVTVDGVTQKKYLNFDIDLDNNKIVFRSGSIPGVGTNNVVIDYDYNTSGTTYIYPDKPRGDLTKSYYPRIGITVLTNNASRMGIGDTDRWHNITIQADVLSIEGLKCTISGETKEGQDVVNYMASEIVTKTFNPSSPIYTGLEVIDLLQDYPQPYDEVTNQFRRILSFSFQQKNVGTH